MTNPQFSNTYYSPCKLPSFSYSETIASAIIDAQIALAADKTLDSAQIFRIEDNGKLTPVAVLEWNGGKIEIKIA